LLRSVVCLCAFLAACTTSPAPVGSVSLPDIDPVPLVPSATIGDPTIDESSGIVASRLRPGLYWTHNDSGGKPEIFAIDAAGMLVGKPVRILGATNVDWEDIASDEAGNLWIADIGNNLNARTDLCLYVVPEPDPLLQQSARVARKLSFSYPDQTLFPPPRLEFDAEALFIAFGRPYILTKHRGSTSTKLYRMDRGMEDGRYAPPLTLLGVFDVRGMVTGADASPDGRRIVVLTYTAVWLFEARGNRGVDEDWFGGAIRWLPIRARQCEGICFDRDGSLLITNEQKDVFRLRVEELISVRE